MSEHLIRPTSNILSVGRLERLLYARQRYRLTQLPHRHRVVGTVVVAGDGVEVWQPVPVLITGANIQAQQAGLLMIPQRLLRRQTRGGKL